MRVGELAQPLINYCKWESEPHVLTGKHSGARSRDMGANELAQEHDSRPYLLLMVALGGLGRVVLESLPWCGG